MTKTLTGSGLLEGEKITSAIIVVLTKEPSPVNCKSIGWLSLHLDQGRSLRSLDRFCHKNLHCGAPPSVSWAENMKTRWRPSSNAGLERRAHTINPSSHTIKIGRDRDRV
ncbi:hypothetical protein TIFTF001_009687 [Ficus carica]|uniref:Uncharacterized protein n=1 Tax=Ficus carica TaxID=3494 RepID=A0AA87ZVQ6_FICCA|nr:hypothetical protein TIFTF001_009687 [Ficus carica]